MNNTIINENGLLKINLDFLVDNYNNLKKSDLVKSVEKLSKAGSNIDAILVIDQELK